MGFLDGDKIRERCGLVAFPAVLARAWLAQSLAERGHFLEGIAYGQEGIRIAEMLDHPFSLALALWGLAHLYGVRGDLGEAIRLHERSIALCRQWDFAAWVHLASGALGWSCVRSGRVEEGVSLMERALPALEGTAFRLFHSLMVWYLGEGHLRANRLQEAAVAARRTLTLARERAERGYEAWALYSLGNTASHGEAEELGTADARFREAKALADELGMRPLLAHCHFGLGKLCHRGAKRQEGDEHTTTATTMYREMGMTYWLEEAGRELEALRSSDRVRGPLSETPGP